MTVSGLASGVVLMPRNTALSPSKDEDESKSCGPRSTVAIWPSRMIVSPRVATTSLLELLGLLERRLGIDVLLGEVALHLAGGGGEVVVGERVADIERRDAERRHLVGIEPDAHGECGAAENFG